MLVVDDEQDILLSVGLVLKRLLPESKIVTAASGMDGLAIMADERLGVLLTDYRMPVMDGFQLITQARAIDPGLPVVMMTAYSDPQLALAAERDHGVAVLLSKPFEMEYLAKVLLATMAGVPAPPPPGR